MRMITFSVIKKCRIKSALYQLSRTITINSDELKPKFDFNKLAGDPKFVEVLPSWKADEEPGLRAEVLRNMRILPDFVTEEEEASLLAEVEPQLKRMRYEFDHWDNAIEGYRETERSAWREENEAVLTRIRAVFPPGATLLPHVHVLDLAAAGHIKPHVDAVRGCGRREWELDPTSQQPREGWQYVHGCMRRKHLKVQQSIPSPLTFYPLPNTKYKFCGDVIAGLCLLSSAVMRLTHEKHPHLVLDALLQRRSLYIMSGVARYDFAHEVLGGEHSVWRGEKLPRKRRIAVICRQQPSKTDEA